jgi:cellulose synthase-like protein
VDFQDYHVHIPMTPDNQPMDEDGGKAGDQQFVSGSLFTGGFNSVTRAHVMDKGDDAKAMMSKGAAWCRAATPG